MTTKFRFIMRIAIIVILLLSVGTIVISAQKTLIREGIIINNTITGTWSGDNIPRSVPTKFIYRNNSITSQNSEVYMLQAGDEHVHPNNNNLKGQLITGNKLTWNGTDKKSITHGIFTGFNIDATIVYNYLDKVPMGIIRKSNGMTNTVGGVAYNIVNKSQAVGIVVKGMNEVHIYNNTIYSDQKMYTGPGQGTWRGLIDVYSHTDITPIGTSEGTKIKNNIFYTVNQIYNIYIYDENCLTNFESDYNVFYCEAGTPIFNYLGRMKTFAEWQALGFDTHSVVINPNFNNTTDLVPVKRLDYGTNLGNDWQTGLSVTAKWVAGVSPATAIQNGKWQVGARIYNNISVEKVSLSSSSSLITTDNGTLQIDATILPTNVSDHSVTWNVESITGQATISSSGLLTAERDGIVKIIATSNANNSIKGEMLITISGQKVLAENVVIKDELNNDTIKGIGKIIKLFAVFTPLDVTNKSLNWSIENISGKAEINQQGELKTIMEGKIRVVAKSIDGSGVIAQNEYTIVIPLFEQHILFKDIKIYPNPTSGKLNIQLSKIPIKGINLEIRNPLGHLILQKNITEIRTELLLEQNPFGIYIVSLSNRESSSEANMSLKIIKK